jgi:hypothetical protein
MLVAVPELGPIVTTNTRPEFRHDLALKCVQLVIVAFGLLVIQWP